MKINISSQRKAGSTIVLAVLTIALLGGFVALAVDYTSNIARNGQRDRVFNNAVEIGDGCISEAFAAWRQICKTSASPNPPTSTFAIPTPSAGNFPSFPGATITNFTVQAVDPLVTLTTVNPPLSALPTGSPPPQTTGPGSGTFSYFYLATADVTLPAVKGTLTAKVRRIFEKRYTSPWNWAMMYDGNLELHPDSNLTLDGWVHSNANVYVGNGTADPLATPSPTLTFTDRLTYQGNYTVGFDPNDIAHAGQVNVAAPTTPADLPPGREQSYSMFGWDTKKFDPTDNNFNNDGYHELLEQRSTSGPAADPFKDQRLYDQANVAITIDGSNVVRVYTGTGDSKTLVTGSSGNNLNSTAYQAAGNSIKPGYYLQDNREQANVRVVDFDVAEFINYFPDYNTKGWNGIIYITDTSGTPSTKRAVRIVNGSHLPDGGMTVVSNNPVYIQGDFNTGRTSTVEPPSNTGDTSDPDASGYTHQPASVMGDAITLLSNSWNDGNSYAGLGSRIASNTTVNAALVAGNVPTGTNGAIYSGGGENFVRFLEDWTGKNFTFYGSLINVYASNQGIGAWGNANVYNAPLQSWFFDKTLSIDAGGNPVKVPGYVSTVAYLQQQRWYLQY